MIEIRHGCFLSQFQEANWIVAFNWILYHKIKVVSMNFTQLFFCFSSIFSDKGECFLCYVIQTLFSKISMFDEHFT